MLCSDKLSINFLSPQPVQNDVIKTQIKQEMDSSFEGSNNNNMSVPMDTDTKVMDTACSEIIYYVFEMVIGQFAQRQFAQKFDFFLEK